MEIRDLKASTDGKSLYTYTIYIPTWELSLQACRKKGKEEGKTWDVGYSKFEENKWISHWQFNAEAQKRFMSAVKRLVDQEVEALESKSKKSRIPETQEEMPWV